ncbi:hypothetical protein LTR66_009015 [Elasticomyces elasticus]|nr:hypothetical protein LTR66_009015 [Elasticomyces elasticus]
MCGISCILTLQNSSHEHAQPGALPNGHDHQTNGDTDRARLARELDESLESIKHRGPDSRGQWISDNKRVAFGHVRLAINDLSPEGAQPFHSPDNKVHAVVNGEFYDYDRIREDLLSKTSYPFRGRSDSELIIALYQYHGLNFMHYLRGEFACVLFDEETQQFVAVRDRYGIKPLYWTVQEGRLLVAAECKAFLALGWKPEWDVKSLLDAGWNHDERTLFKGVAKSTVDNRTPEEMIEGVRQHMLESIRLRLRADVPVGVYLSGGIDSSVIAGMVTHLVKEQGIAVGSADPTSRVSCFSIAFEEASGFDESAIANRTADWLGVKFHKKFMNEEELVKRFEDATWHIEHHNPDLNFVGKYALSEVPQEAGYKVVLTGEGADENFGGYPVYLPDYLREPDPSYTKYNTLSEEERKKQFDIREEEAKMYYASVGADASNRGPSVQRRMLNDISTGSSMAAFQLDVFAPWTACYGSSDPQRTIANNADGRVRNLINDSWHPLHSAQYIWSKGHLANIFLTCLGDRTEMAHSIEARTPFLDHGLTEYVNGLPPSVKIRWDPEEKRFVEKWILREASKPFITKELYERKKHPYSAPTTYPLNGPLHTLLSSLITPASIARLGFVDWDKCKDLVRNAFERGDVRCMRYAIVVAEWVVLSRRFGVGRAGEL